jgi:hypothetical protein
LIVDDGSGFLSQSSGWFLPYTIKQEKGGFDGIGIPALNTRVFRPKVLGVKGSIP